jgi:hypothetical protein
MLTRKKNPTIRLVTKKQLKSPACEPTVCKMCEPPSHPGISQTCQPSTIKCMPGAGPGYQTTCEPDMDEGCVPAAAPGYICDRPRADKINLCSPAGSTGDPQ